MLGSGTDTLTVIVSGVATADRRAPAQAGHGSPTRTASKLVWQSGQNITFNSLALPASEHGHGRRGPRTGRDAAGATANPGPVALPRPQCRLHHGRSSRPRRWSAVVGGHPNRPTGGQLGLPIDGHLVTQRGRRRGPLMLPRRPTNGHAGACNPSAFNQGHLVRSRLLAASTSTARPPSPSRCYIGDWVIYR